MSREADLFDAVCDRPPAERAALLDQACAGDPALRARIEGLLAGLAEAERAFPAALVGGGIPAPEEKPGDAIGRYQLREKVGEGGCGVVWRAEQAEPVRRQVALKVIRLGMNTKAVIARFDAERQALALMAHPNIAKVFDAGATESGRPFFAMELVRGLPITRHCDEHQLSATARLKLFIEVCHAIQHAHEKGIIHRDIKPSNVLVTRLGDAAVPVVIDFGIAKATQGRLSDATLFMGHDQFIGTPAYMSPEQAEVGGREVDARTDIYSLGVLLYELLAGRPPFDPKALQQAGVDGIRRIIREEEPARPSTWLRRDPAKARSRRRGEAEETVNETGRPRHLGSYEDVAGDLDWIVMKAIEKDRARRYESARAFAQDVQRHLAHLPVTARPPSAAYVGAKFLRRHRVAVAAAALVAVTAFVSALVSIGF